MSLDVLFSVRFVHINVARNRAAGTECCQVPTRSMPHNPNKTKFNPVTLIKLNIFHPALDGFATVQNIHKIRTGIVQKIVTFVSGNGVPMISDGSRWA